MHSLPGGPSIAYRQLRASRPDTGPTLVFLPGYMSDMSGSKASALIADAERKGRGCLLFDYSGCGLSEGAFADGTLSRWRDEVVSLVESRIEGGVLLVGSSMGGWLMLMVALALGERVSGMIGIAAAPDFTRWGLDEAARAQLEAGETLLEDNPYGPEPTPTYPGFYADANRHLMLGSSIAINCPVRLLHGQRDPDVPWEISLKLASALASDDVETRLIKDGDHRLSRPDDIAILLSEVSRFYETGSAEA